jgi:2-polyprenyl-6-methoxyphenol hydroxylase-like FAD-dependent oxidoreductase
MLIATLSGGADVRSITTGCCIVGSGPTGAMLALLLARKGIDVTLLEAHHDFDRDFRGDTVHPSTLEIMAQLGLIDRLLELPHVRVETISGPGPMGPQLVADLRGLGFPYPFIMMVPQAKFLEFVVEHTRHYSNFRLVMGATVNELIEEDGLVVGVRCRTPAGLEEVRTGLTVATDGRFSKVRSLSGLPYDKFGSPMDVLWFRLPRRSEDGVGLVGRFGAGFLFILLDRGETWQIAALIPKGGFGGIRAEGIEGFRERIRNALPHFADRAEILQDWKQVAVLSVEVGRLRHWHKPGLLLLGDAAHTMSPIGGVGINVAILDAVAAANLLAKPLHEDQVTDELLAKVEKQRSWSVKLIQGFQLRQQMAVIRMMDGREPPRFPRALQFRWLRWVFLRLLFYGGLRAPRVR